MIHSCPKENYLKDLLRALYQRRLKRQLTNGAEGVCYGGHLEIGYRHIDDEGRADVLEAVIDAYCQDDQDVAKRPHNRCQRHDQGGDDRHR